MRKTCISCSSLFAAERHACTAGLNGRGHNILHVVAAEGNADSLRLLLDLCADDFWPSSTVLSAMSSFAVAAANAVLATATTLVPFSSSYGWMGHGQENCKIAAETHDQ